MPQQQDKAAVESYAAVLRAAAEQNDKPGDADSGSDSNTANDEGSVALTAVFSAWRRGVKALVGDMAGLAAAEGKLAAVGAAQLFLGVQILVSLATLALICLEIALALLLYYFALSPLVIVLLLFAVNVLLAIVIVRLLMPLTANFNFEHTRQMLSRSDAASDLGKATEPTEQSAAATTGKA